jgi:thiamine biosynthesis lipoprotein
MTREVLDTAMSKPRRLHFSRPAMAATFEIILDVDRPEPELAIFAENAFELVKHLEGQISAYISSSDVCWINATAAERPARLEPRLYDLLKSCRQLHEETDGSFDVTVGPLVRVWGFFRRQGKMPDPVELEKARAKVGMEHIRFDDEERSVRFDKPGMEINLGAVGKGYVVDRVVEALRGWGVRCGLVHSARSSIAVIGKPPLADGWVLGVTDPRETDKALGSLTLVDSTMSVSGNWEQVFTVEGKTYSHILDPRTGRPAQGIISTTVVGPSAAVTDARATAFFVMGVEKTRHYCEERKDIGAVILAGSSPDQMAIHTFNCVLEREE